MPDPRDPTPVKVEARGSGFVVVDKDGKKVKEGGPFPSRERAEQLAASINAAWDRAKGERRSKGAPELTEGLAGRFREILHPRVRGGRLRGEFAKKLTPAGEQEIGKGRGSGFANLNWHGKSFIGHIPSDVRRRPR